MSLVLLAVVQWMRGDIEESRSTFERAFAEAKEVQGGRGDFTIAFISAYWAWLAQMAGDSSEAMERAQSAIVVASEHGFLTWQAAAYIHLLAAMCQLGMVEPAMSGLEQTIEAWTKAGAGLMIPYFLAQLAAAKLTSGAAGEARTFLDEALDASACTGERLYEAEILRLRAHARRAAGDDDAAVVADLEAAAQAAYGRNQRVVLRALVDLAAKEGAASPAGPARSTSTLRAAGGSDAKVHLSSPRRCASSRVPPDPGRRPALLPPARDVVRPAAGRARAIRWFQCTRT